MSKKEHNPWSDVAIVTVTLTVGIVVVIAVIKYTILGLVAIWNALP